MQRSEQRPAAVPLRAQQAGEAKPRWGFVERSVWTERMLETLERGIEGGKWFRLIDKVFAPDNLAASTYKVCANGGVAGIDKVTTKDFSATIDANVAKLSEQLRAGEYRPQAIRRVQIPKPGSTETRPLGIPTVRDRVVQKAVVGAIEPIFERDFAEHSFGFRPGRGCKDALRRVDGLLQDGCHYVVDADLKSYFDTIPHGPLMDRLRTKIADGRVLSLIESFLQASIMEGLREWTPEQGAPQGAVLSPLLSNVYLDPLDHLLAERGFAMTRYADDFIIQCRTKEEAEAALEIVRQWVMENGLTLHPTKTRIADVRTDGFDFLGYHFRGANRWPRKKSMDKLKAGLRGKTQRQSGHALEVVFYQVNETVRGWYLYFKHSSRWTFRPLDSWIRMRLRSILRKRAGRRGRGRGRDHQRWPNVFFRALGLFNLEAAWQRDRQSALR